VVNAKLYTAGSFKLHCKTRCEVPRAGSLPPSSFLSKKNQQYKHQALKAWRTGGDPSLTGK